jgi:4'-phosphopantetheinyl transferase EntD
MGPLLKRVHTAMLLRTLLPDEIYCSEQIGTLAGELFAEEASLLGPGSVEKRWREFAAGRSCARKALAASGHAPVAVLQGAGREPVWPQGIVGSITHCSTYLCESRDRCRTE